MEVITEKDIEVVVDSAGEVSTNSALEADVTDNTDLAVSVNRKEFSIVGDELYIPKRYEDAPQWLRDLISTVTEQSYTQKITELNNLSTSLQQLIVELEVAKNTYTQSIISSNDIDERINTAITTLNSSLSSSDATIVDLISTKTTPDEASAIALNTISSSINNGEIGALVGSVSSTLTTETEALANNIDLVHAEMLGGFESTADVIQTTQAYVGIDEAGASTGTGLSAYLEDSAGNIGGADSQVANAVYINNGVPTSKFEYTSNLNKNGVHYKSGFGLKTLTTGGDGSATNPYDSEFWINAAKFKFTNDNVTGQVAPFTIDATGVTPKVTFNGNVSFTNVTGTSDLVSTASIQNAIANNVTTIDGGKIVTNQVFVNNLNAVGGVVADTITGNVLNGTVVNGSVINGARINGSVIKASYLDLDGELEVLTNYHISVTTRNANPSLYTDAVYISADNEYRIPSMSIVKEETKAVNLSSLNASSTSLIKPYNTANVGHNNKCVSIRPTLNYNGTVLTITVNVAPFSVFDGAENKLTSYATSLYCFGTFVGRFKLISTTGTGSVVYTKMYVNDVVANSFSVDINGIVFAASLSAGLAGGTSTLTVSISCPNRQLYSNFTSGDILYAVTNSTPSRATSGNAINTSVSSTSIFTTSSGMTVNNMI